MFEVCEQLSDCLESLSAFFPFSLSHARPGCSFIGGGGGGGDQTSFFLV